jgi:transposase
MSEKLNSAIAVIGIDIGKNSFHIVGQDGRGAIVLRQKWSRGQVESRLANLPACLIGMEACVGAHHLSRKLQLLGHDALGDCQASGQGRVRAPVSHSRWSGA